jgi:hypothetical protein
MKTMSMSSSSRKYLQTFIRMLWVVAVVAVPCVGSAVTVKAIMGTVAYSTDGVQYRGVKTGMDLAQGVTLRTGQGAAVELALGEPAGMLRLTENTQLTLTRTGGVVARAGEPEWRYDLTSGIVVGFDNQVTKPSRFQISTPAGLVGVGASQYRIDARGYLVAMDGLLIMAQPAPDDDGKVKTDILLAPPSVFFAPGYGVQNSPPALVNEVSKQIKTPLEMNRTNPSQTVDAATTEKKASTPQLFDSTIKPERRSQRRF